MIFMLTWWTKLSVFTGTWQIHSVLCRKSGLIHSELYIQSLSTAYIQQESEQCHSLFRFQAHIIYYLREQIKSLQTISGGIVKPTESTHLAWFDSLKYAYKERFDYGIYAMSLHKAK